MSHLTLHDVRIYGDAAEPCPLVWLNTFEDEGGAVWQACLSLHAPAFRLAAIPVRDWNGDLSPWAADAVYPKDAPFAGNADRYLSELTALLPDVEAMLPATPRYHAIAGYSLAGLFALYALYRTDRLSRAASASGSLWFPGFAEYAAAHGMCRLPDAVYLSLGDREHRTRNPVMAAVQQNTQRFYAYCQAAGICSLYEQNPGNHFQDTALRMAKGITWMLTAAD